MFKMCNYKSASYTVGKFWATKSVMHYRDRARASWHEDQVVPSSDYSEKVDEVAKRSLLVSALIHKHDQRPSAVRVLQSVSRGGADELRVRDWVLVTQPTSGGAIVGRVDELLQVVFPGGGGSVVRVWCSQVGVAFIAPDHSVCAHDGGDDDCSIVCFESSHLEVVKRVAYSGGASYIR